MSAAICGNATPDVALLIPATLAAADSREAVVHRLWIRKSKLDLTGPVSCGVFTKVICRARNPSAEMRGGFLRWRAAKYRSPHERSDMRERLPGCRVAHPGYARCGGFPRSSCAPPVDKKIETRLTGPVSCGVLFKVNRRAQNPSAELRGGFLR
jgi:hypothetical protein